MKTKISFKQKLTAIAIGSLFSLSAIAQTVTFNVTTVSPSGSSSTPNVFACWITDANGTFVKTINRQAATRISYLSKWITSTPTKNVTDATTGATMSIHNALYTNGTNTTSTGAVVRKPFVWNCKNVSGTVVADGTYYVNVEFAEEASGEKYAQYVFTKGTTSQNLTYTNVSSYFTNATLQYAPLSSGVELVQNDLNLQVSYLKSSQQIQVKLDNTNNDNLYVSLYNSRGALIFKKAITNVNSTFSAAGFPNGVYFVKVSDATGTSATNKILVY
ncbi:T9SS type A sorting domain-containing protein [Parabacteroides sp. FAFU027]|uniref:T9SS type A sorting domain-containing protein n=1 Tax=Parabacteroides sp. FAFU027 TaxID=2922715 RepID=UPI001FAEAEFA|nr:T9SS type A sorting domain-containing protein [Parabacteroides sp. FAFU027]